jgi:MFS family permease
MARSGFYGWTMLSALWAVMFLNLGFPAYGPAVINAAMARSLGLDRETLGNMFSVYMVMSGLPGPLVALSVNHIGVRRTLMTGSALIIAGALLMATVVASGIGAMLSYGLLVGAGVATGGALASQAGLARWFVRRRALALSILYSAGAIGGFVAAPLLNRLIETTGDWRTGWWLLAGLSLLAAVIALALVREQPADLGQFPDGIAAPAEGTNRANDTRPAFITRHSWTVGEALRRPTYWLILLSLVGGSGGYTLFLAHGVVHLQDLGHSRTIGAWAVSVVTVTGLGAKGVIAVLGDRFDPRYIWAVFLAIFGVGLVLVVDAHSRAQVFLFAACLGIGFGGGIVCIMAVLSNYYGTAAFASLAGLAVAVNTTLSAIAPKVAGHLFDQGIGYGGTFHFLAAWCFVGAAVLWFLKPPLPVAGAATGRTGA